MYIKSMTIRGFKTYRQETVISDFSPHANMILGKNGSGKSNLLDAIQFVLSDKYSQLRADDRAKLLHEGAGRDTTVADVEIVFDNSDKQIPLEPPKGDKDNTDVRMRRTIGGKKDQILVNNTPYTQQDFQTLLESTGMSRSNPYNIVEQGKIASLMKQSKAQRLALFKEIAGTRVYDERRQESLKIMRETDQKRATIDTVIEVLEKRIEELKAESQEFEKFQTLDTTRRSLEYAIYDRERVIAAEKLEEIEKKRAGGTSNAEREGAAYAEARKAVQQAEEEVELLKTSIARAQAAKRSLGPAHSDQVARRTELQMSVKELTERLSGMQGNKKKAAEQLDKLHKQIKETKEKSDGVTSELSGLLAEEEKLETQYQRLDQRLQDVCAKRERSSKYKGKKERDAELKKNIARAKKQREESQRHADNMAAEMAKAQADADRLEKELAAKEEQINANRAQAEKINAQLQTAAQQRDKNLDAKKAAWGREADLKAQQSSLASELDKANRNLRHTMDKDLARGLDSVRTIASDLNLSGVYGPLIELFTCGPEFHTAVEITGGNSLFGVVVDTAATATVVIQELIKRKGGRVTFVPLDKITPAQPEYPAGADAMPMIKHLKYDAKYHKAFLQTFGKTLIARDLRVAASISLQHNLDTITLAGDRVDKKGALTGGYTDFGERSRLQAQADIAATQEKIQALGKDLRASDKELKKLESDHAKTLAELSRLSEQKATLRAQTTQFTQDVTSGKREHKALVDTAARTERALPSIRASLASLDTQLSSLQAELESDFASGLDEGEEAELRRLTLEVDELKQQLVKLRKRRAEVEARKSELDSLLFNNLQRKEEELQRTLNTATQEDDKDVLQRDEQELANITAAVKEVEAQMKQADSEVEKATVRIRQLEKELDTLRANENAAAHLLSDDAKNMDKLLSQRIIYVAKRDDCVKKIRELGALPNEAFDKYKGLDIKKLMSRLEKTNADLKKMGGINKKALDQYTSFMEEKASLIERKKELDDGRTSIEDLISHLDAKKDEAIERTFKTIAKNFSEVFSELVPSGKAQLQMETAGLDDEEGEEGEEDGEERKESDRARSRSKKKARKEKEPPKIGSFTGVHIQVSFGGASSATHQLSGGQESVVALSLIFAIQRCDPSPFYLLDEIDSALDPVHRSAVANMLREQSKSTQFICTTFHPELLAAADKFFGVVFRAKASFVSVIDRHQAEGIIKIAEREAEQ